ncbi:MAG: hypothetical protein Q8N54_01120 [Sulfurimicrobium sp.]|nr:hypothetical protein [Sulfurimicrobium sp.]MDZ7656285.1 hypothetical protein [Sulfurimicrobium sp.]
MSNQTHTERLDELLTKLERGAGGLHSLGDLLCNSRSDFLDDAFLDSLGGLLMTVSDAMLDYSTEGYKYTISQQPPAIPLETP